MLRHLCLYVCFVLFGFSLFLVEKSSANITLSTQDKVPFNRWVSDTIGNSKKLKSYNSLTVAKIQLSQKNYEACYKSLLKTTKSSSSILPWVVALRIECANLAFKNKKNASNLKLLERALAPLNSNSSWLLLGPYAQKLRQMQVDSLLNIGEYYVKVDRVKAQRTFDELNKRQEWLNKNQKARVLYWTGELAFVRQRLKDALSYFQRSMEEEESSEARDRINAIHTLLKESEESSSKSTPTKDTTLGMSEDERKIYERMNRAIKTNDWIAAVEDGVELINNYPGSQKANWAADRIYSIFFQVASQPDSKFEQVLKRVVNKMRDVEVTRLHGWIERAYRDGFYEQVISLAKPALKVLEDTSLSTSILFRQAQSYLYTNQDSEALNVYEKIIQKHSGTRESLISLLRVALINFRKKDFSASTANLERLLILADENDSLNLIARYWLWRSLQNVDMGRADIVGKELAERYPLTYYGLRAKAELNNNQLILPGKDVKFSYKMNVTSSERKNFDRIKLLLKIGWYDEAQAELDYFYDPAEPKAKALLAEYWASALSYINAIKLLNEAWDNDRETLGVSTLKVGFPQEFKKSIFTESKKNQLEPYLVWSLIRQESAFNINAVSRSKAMGLMQLIPPTAEEVREELKIKKSSFDPFDPETNIKLGTKYLGNMMTSFSRNVPWALASYNAGPHRFGKWAKRRELSEASTSDPMHEVWIDELPWNETSFYVKAILRNLMIYRCLDRGPVTLSNPIWAFDVEQK